MDMDTRLHGAATDLLRGAGFAEQPDGSWKPLIASPAIPLIEDIALPEQVAPVLDTTLAGLAQRRYRGTGPKFVKVGKRVIYRWSDVRAYLEENTIQRNGESPVGAA